MSHRIRELLLWREPSLSYLVTTHEAFLAEWSSTKDQGGPLCFHPTLPRSASTKSFQLLQNAFLQSEGLPFADVLSEEEIREAFVAANACFAQDEDDIYTPAVTLWAWLSQTLHAGALRSCAAAVARVGVLCVMLNRQPPSPDTGDYCRARAKLPECEASTN